MTAYDEYARERAALDGLLAEGYRIVGAAERLDGAEVTLVRAGNPAARAKLHLLTADARKYMSYLVLNQKAQLQAPSSRQSQTQSPA